MLALTGKPCLWEPRRLRLRLFSAAAQLVTTAGRRHLRFALHWPWTDVITSAIQRLDGLPNPRLSRNNHPTQPAAPPTVGPEEPGAHPMRQPGHRSTRHRLDKPKRATGTSDDPSRKIEAKESPIEE